jgi:diaminopimelate decarboxylase
MHRFHYRNGELWCEQVRVADVVERVGTPLYLYSQGTILDHWRKLKQAFAPIGALLCYAVKANANLAICRIFARLGAGFDIVSGGELYQVLRAGADPNKIVYASVGKTEAEIRQAIRAGILLFNAESAPELEQIDRMAAQMGRRPKVSLRLNPGVDPETHTFIATGQRATKFGMEAAVVEDLFRRRNAFPHLDLVGLHLHIGSQILHSRPFVLAIRRALNVVESLRREGIVLHYLNIGGGLGISYRPDDRPQTAAQYARSVLPLLKRARLKIILEPGRFLVGSSGILVTRVLYVKKSCGRRFAIVDAGMNDLIRPSLYGAYHSIEPVVRSSHLRRVRYDVVGPVCESGDFLGKNRSIAMVAQGDLLAVMGVGAYGFVMSSNYNGRPRAAEVLVRGNRWHIVRRRETFTDLVRGESLPPWIA